MDISITQALLLSGVTGICTAVGTVTAIKVDIGWLKREVQRHDKDLNEVFERLRELEKARS